MFVEKKHRETLFQSLFLQGFIKYERVNTLLAKKCCLATLLFLLELEAHSTQTEAHNVKQMRNPKEIIYCKLELLRRRKILHFIKYKIITHTPFDCWVVHANLTSSLKGFAHKSQLQTFTSLVVIILVFCNLRRSLKVHMGFQKEKCNAWDVQIHHIY